MLPCRKILFAFVRSNPSKSFVLSQNQITFHPSVSLLSSSWSYVQVKHLSVTPILKKKHTREQRRERRRNRRERGWQIISNIQHMTDSFVKKWPTLHKYYRQIAEGNRYQLSAFRTWRDVTKRRRENLKYETTYREEKAIFNFKNSLLKMTCLFPLFMMPMGFFLVMIPIATFPQVMLPRCYWSSKQRQKFLTQMHRSRTYRYGIIVHHLTYLKNNHPSPAFKRMLDELLAQINGQKVPTNNDLHKIRTWSRNEDNPLNLSDAPPVLAIAFCQVNNLWPYLPASFALHYLHKRAVQIMDLDRKLEKENLVPSLSDVELQDATFVRGLNSTELSTEANRYWLSNWINLTKICDESDASFILHAMMLQSYNYTEVKYQRRIFDNSPSHQ